MMGKDRKEEIIMATLELASEIGLGSVSMSMIADKVGIRKPSLYNHYGSREEIVEAMYKYLRDKARKSMGSTMVDYGELLKGKTALEVLQFVVGNYQKMNEDKYMQMFYKVIYSERSIDEMAAKIMVEETEKMILATKQLFYAFQVHGLLTFQNADMSAVAFAMTIHSLMDYMMDKNTAKVMDDSDSNDNIIGEYLQWFCMENR